MIILIFYLEFIILQPQQMILNSEIINRAKYYINHSNEYELDLRSKSITAVSSLYATMNFFESIDLSNNLLTRLENSSYLDRLVTLIVSNNRISSIGKIGENLPNLQNLFLVGNRIKAQTEVVSLASCCRLSNLALNGNPITQVPGYRRATIEALKSLKVLDFKKVEGSELQEDVAHHLKD